MSDRSEWTDSTDERDLLRGRPVAARIRERVARSRWENWDGTQPR